MCRTACNSQVDVVFVVDVSGSVQRHRVEAIRELLVSVVADLDVGPNSTRVGAVYFSNASDTAFTLNQYTTRQDVQEALRRIPYAGGRSNIAAGLRTARYHFLQASRLTEQQPVPGIGSVAEWLACWTQAQKGPGSNRSRDAVGQQS